MMHPMNPKPARIAFEHVSVSFPAQGGPRSGLMRVVDDVSFRIHDREFVSVIGPSGCGKTTMMNIVAGFMQPSSGKVTLDGRPIAGPGPDRGVIFQEYGVFPWLTVKDNIAFGLKLRANKTNAETREERRGDCDQQHMVDHPRREQRRRECAERGDEGYRQHRHREDPGPASPRREGQESQCQEQHRIEVPAQPDVRREWRRTAIGSLQRPPHAPVPSVRMRMGTPL